MEQQTLWLVISMPLAAFSFFTSYFVLKKYKWVPTRKFWTGLLTTVVPLGLVIGLMFVNVIAALVVMALTFPADSMFIWFMTQPYFEKSHAKRDEILKNKKKRK